MTAEARPSRLISLSYATRSDVKGQKDATRVLLCLDGGRGEDGLHGQVRDAGLFRDAMMTAVTILGSDLRHKSKDRSAYLAYLAKKGKKATAAIWAAHKAFLDESLAGDQHRETALPPLLSVHPDEVALEVFSRDESAYARLALSADLFAGRQAAHGTTFADLSPALCEGLDSLRAYQAVTLDAGVSLRGTGPAHQSAVEVPYRLLRGFLQVQSAATLPAVSCELAAIDLYNLLFALRLRKAKKAPRALRFELVPGSPPRLVLEPWEIVLEGHGPPFAGRAPRVVRTFGRQRLVALARLLPHVQAVRVHLLGPGLPVFWVLDLGPGRGALTLGLTGWTESGWSSAASFDALMPGENEKALADRLFQRLLQAGPLSLSDLMRAGNATADRVRAAMQLLCLRGQVVFDLHGQVYRPRALLAEPVSEAAIRYGSAREAQAHRLLSGDGVVKLIKIHEIAGEGTEICGEVTDQKARRSYAPRFTLDLEGRTRDASCGCPQHRRAGLRPALYDPCEHLIALRLFHARRRAEEEARRNTPEGRLLIRAETRTLVRREESGQESVYRVSLDDRVVRLAFGRQPDLRHQRLWFDTDGEAREAYFGRLEALAAQGYIDADAF